MVVIELDELEDIKESRKHRAVKLKLSLEILWNDYHVEGKMSLEEYENKKADLESCLKDL